MWGNNKKIRSSKIETLIGQGIEIKGDLKFTGGLHLDGAIIGDVTTKDDGDSVLVISDHGCIEGDIHVTYAIINGKVKGDVYASKKLELSANASITGNVHYSVLEMASGAEVNGNMVHDTGVHPARIAGPAVDSDTDATEKKVHKIDPTAALQK